MYNALTVVDSFLLEYMRNRALICINIHLQLSYQSFSLCKSDRSVYESLLHLYTCIKYNHLQKAGCYTLCPCACHRHTIKRAVGPIQCPAVPQTRLLPLLMNRHLLPPSIVVLVETEESKSDHNNIIVDMIT